MNIPPVPLLSQAAKDAARRVFLCSGCEDQYSVFVQEAIDTETFDLQDELQLAEGEIEGLTAELNRTHEALAKLPEQLVRALYDSGRDMSGKPVISVYWDGCSSEGRDKDALLMVIKPVFEAALPTS